MSEKKEKLSVGQEAAEIKKIAHDIVFECQTRAHIGTDRLENLAAAMIDEGFDKIIEERGLGSETPDSVGNCESNETGLAPCPFCGSTNSSYAPSGYRVYGGGYHVTCCNPNCLASVFLPTPGSRTGIEIWNTRVPLTSSPSSEVHGHSEKTKQ